MPPIKPDGIAFYGGPFSNFKRSPIKLPHPFCDEEVIYPTVEHRYQAMKATNEADHDLIAVRGTPADAKIKGNNIKLRDDWEEVKLQVMHEALVEKYKIPTFREDLLATGDKFIYEDSPFDNTWGLFDPKSKTYTGQNLLGELLMIVRTEILEER